MKVAMLGDNCIDVYRMIDGREVNRQYPTGNVVDTGVNLQKLGIPTSVISTTGDDENGAWMVRVLREMGLDLTRFHVAHGPTAITYMDMNGTDRVHGDYVEGVLENMVFDAEDIAFAARHDLVHTALWGKDRLEDTLCGLVFSLSPRSFYQVNRAQAEKLYLKALDLALLTGKETALDLYCGAGTITLCLAKRAGRVIGAEIVEDAVRDARENARKNGISNAEFLCADASEAAETLARRGLRPDIVTVDPPRKGLAPEVIGAIAAMSPGKVVYVSCDPATLARDIKLFSEAGYRASRACAVDMFPRCAHVETVVLLSHKDPDSHIHVKVEFGEGKDKVPLDKIAERAEKYKPKEKVTYKKIKEYIEDKFGFKVHTAYIAEVKRAYGLPMYDAPNAVEELKQPRKHPTEEKVKAISDALVHFGLINKKQATTFEIAHLSVV